MWRLSLYILYAITLFSSVSAWDPLNSCTLEVQASKPWQVTDAKGILELGILVRFSTSNPPANPLQIRSGGTSDVFEDHHDGTYDVGFSVSSEEYENWQLEDIVTSQWQGTHLFPYDVNSGGKWMVLSVNC